MWEIPGASGISSGTSSAVGKDSDWLQPGPGGPMGSKHPSCRAALPGQTGILIYTAELRARWSVLLGECSMMKLSCWYSGGFLKLFNRVLSCNSSAMTPSLMALFILLCVRARVCACMCVRVCVCVCVCVCV